EFRAALLNGPAGGDDDSARRPGPALSVMCSQVKHQRVALGQKLVGLGTAQGKELHLARAETVQHPRVAAVAGERVLDPLGLAGGNAERLQRGGDAEEAHPGRVTDDALRALELLRAGDAPGADEFWG